MFFGSSLKCLWILRLVFEQERPNLVSVLVSSIARYQFISIPLKMVTCIYFDFALIKHFGFAFNRRKCRPIKSFYCHSSPHCFLQRRLKSLTIFADYTRCSTHNYFFCAYNIQQLLYN